MKKVKNLKRVASLFFALLLVATIPMVAFATSLTGMYHAVTGDESTRLKDEVV